MSIWIEKGKYITAINKKQGWGAGKFFSGSGFGFFFFKRLRLRIFFSKRLRLLFFRGASAPAHDYWLSLAKYSFPRNLEAGVGFFWPLGAGAARKKNTKSWSRSWSWS